MNAVKNNELEKLFKKKKKKKKEEREDFSTT